MTWDDYFMTLARVTASKSKDPSTKVGCVIADQKNRVVAPPTYNGFPHGIPDDIELLQDREIKLALTVHAEENALILAGRSVEGCTCYVWPFPPCAPCAAKLIQAGISRVVAPEPTPEQYDRWGKSLALAEWAYSKAGVLFHTHGDTHAKAHARSCAEESPVQLSLPGLT